MNDDKTINGIKYQCARQRNLKDQEIEKTMDLENRIVKMIIKYDDKDEAWSFAQHYKIYWYGDSKKLGIVSIINDYTNKKGKTFKAHYTINGTYIKKAENDTPIHYNGYFRITAKNFKYENNKNAKRVQDLFIPK